MDWECRMCAKKRIEHFGRRNRKRTQVCPDVGERIALKLTVKGVL